MKRARCKSREKAPEHSLQTVEEEDRQERVERGATRFSVKNFASIPPAQQFLTLEIAGGRAGWEAADGADLTRRTATK